MEAAGDCAFRIAASGDIRSASRRAARLLGLPAPPDGMPLSAFVPDADGAALRSAIVEAIAGGRTRAAAGAPALRRARQPSFDLRDRPAPRTAHAQFARQSAGRRARHERAAGHRRTPAPHGDPRRADRTAEPPAAVGPHPHGGGQRAPLGPGLRGGHHRHRRLQEGQRCARPHDRRRRAAPGRHPPAPHHARQRYAGARGRRRIRRDPARHRQRSANQTGHRAA